ncbi:MAG: hypothetical protein WAT19_15370 [Ferruginibacter sp.]
MRKLLLAAVFGFGAFISNAQINKGSLLLGGDVNFQEVKNSSVSSPSAQINRYGILSVSAGKAYRKNKIAGITASAGFNKGIYNNGSVLFDQKQHRITAGAFFRNYQQLKHGFYLFGEAGADYSFGKQTTTDPQAAVVDIMKTNAVSLNFTPGLSYNLCKKLFTEISLPGLLTMGYTHEKNYSYTSNRYYVSSSMNRSFVNSLAVGFRFIL